MQNVSLQLDRFEFCLICFHVVTRCHLCALVRRKYQIADRIEITIGIVLQFAGFVLFWIMPAHGNQDLWKFVVSSVVFVVGLPFVYIAPALQAKLTTKRAQVREPDTQRLFIT